MPRGVYERKSTAKKKTAKKSGGVIINDQSPKVPQPMARTIKAEIIDTLDKFHVRYEDKDGHIAIRNTQMLDRYTITELLDNGIQILNARKDEIGTYIAIYY